MEGIDLAESTRQVWELLVIVSTLRRKGREFALKGDLSGELIMLSLQGIFFQLPELTHPTISISISISLFLFYPTLGYFNNRDLKSIGFTNS